MATALTSVTGQGAVVVIAVVAVDVAAVVYILDAEVGVREGVPHGAEGV